MEHDSVMRDGVPFWQRGWFVLALAVIAVGSLGLTIHYGRAEQHARALRISLTSGAVARVQESMLKKLPFKTAPTRIQYGDRTVDRMTLTVVEVKNTGREYIKGDDVVDTDPLRVSLPQGSEVLGLYTGVTGDDDAVQPVAESRSSPTGSPSVALGFSVLRPGGEFFVMLLHTGNEDEVRALGTVVGLDIMRVVYEDNDWHAWVREPWFSVASTVVAVALFYAVVLFTFPWYLNRKFAPELATMAAETEKARRLNASAALHYAGTFWRESSNSMTDAEREELEAAAFRVKTAMEGTDKDELEEATSALSVIVRGLGGRTGEEDEAAPADASGNPSQ